MFENMGGLHPVDETARKHFYSHENPENLAELIESVEGSADAGIDELNLAVKVDPNSANDIALRLSQIAEKFQKVAENMRQIKAEKPQ